MSRFFVPVLSLVLTLALAAPASALEVESLGALVSPLDEVLGPVIQTVSDVTEGIASNLFETPEPNIIALQGRDAIDAAVAFSQATYGSSNLAVLARNDLYADAVTTGAMQGSLDAPLLLTSSGDLDQRTAAEMQRLGVQRLVVLGGEDAVHPIVSQRLEFAGIDVQRVGGPTRVETALEAAEAFYPSATTAVISRAYPSADGDASQGYADLLAVGPWAAANGWPILLSNTGSLNETVKDYLGDSRITDVVIVGGNAAISPAVEQELADMGLQIRRVAGDTRYATATAIASERGFENSASADRMILAEGTATVEDVWAAGFSGAAHGTKNNAPILLTRGDILPAETSRFITDGIAENVTDGGPVVVCATFVSVASCQAAGLLALGDVTAAAAALGIPLAEIPGINDILTAIGEIIGQEIEVPAAIAEVVDEVVDTVTGVVDEAVDTAGEVVDTVTDAAGADEVGDTVGGIIGGGTAGVADGTTGAVGDAADGATGAVDGATGGATGGATDGATGAVDGATGGATDGATGAVDGATGGATDGATGAVGGAADTATGAVGGATGVLSSDLDALIR